MPTSGSHGWMIPLDHLNGLGVSQITSNVMDIAAGDINDEAQAKL